MESIVSTLPTSPRAPLEVWPTRAQLCPGEHLGIALRGDLSEPVRVRVIDVDHVLAESTVPPGAATALIELPSTLRRAGLAIEVCGASGVRATTAIDVAPHWSVAPRYGFFADFAPGDDYLETFSQLWIIRLSF